MAEVAEVVEAPPAQEITGDYSKELLSSFYNIEPTAPAQETGMPEPQQEIAVEKAEELQEEAEELTPADTIESDTAPDTDLTITSEVTEPAEPVVNVAAPAFDEVAWVKQHFGDEFDSVETVKQKIATPVVQAPTFANEQTKQLYEALLEGREEEVTELFAQRKYAADIKKMAAEDVVKEGWMKEFDLTKEQVERRFANKFKVDDMLDDEDIEIEKKVIAKDIEKEADKYREYFAKYDQPIQLPALQKAEEAPVVQEYQPTPQYTEALKYSAELNKAKPANPGQINFELNDDKAGFSIKGQVSIPKDKLSAIKSKLEGNEAAYFETRYTRADGTFDLDQLCSDVYEQTNRDTIHKAMLTDVSRQLRIHIMKEKRNFKEPSDTITGDVVPSEAEIARAHYVKNWM